MYNVIKDKTLKQTFKGQTLTIKYIKGFMLNQQQGAYS